MTSPTPQTVELLPCPFCGGEPDMPYFGDRVECKACEGSVVGVAAWNTRQPASGDVEAIDYVARLQTLLAALKAIDTPNKSELLIEAVEDERLLAALSIAPVMGRDDVLEEAARAAEEATRVLAGKGGHDREVFDRGYREAKEDIAEDIRALKVQP